MKSKASIVLLGILIFVLGGIAGAVSHSLYQEYLRAAFFKASSQPIDIIGGLAKELNLDAQQIKQAMINLLDNAIAAIKECGHIWVTLTHDPILKRVRIEVADDGTGISDLNKTRMFEPDFSTKKTGMGLGLTIVSSIIADHNGAISVQSNKPRGAKFVIELPI